MIKALFKFSKVPSGYVVIDTTSSSGTYKDLSPFMLVAPPAKRFENLWQFSKVYKQHIGIDGLPNALWFDWRQKGFQDERAHRYPAGKGAVPEYSFWDGQKLQYIEARKQIYIPEYAKNVKLTQSYSILSRLYAEGQDIVLLDYDAYDHQSLGMTLVDVVNNPNRKMGHAFVLCIMLTKKLDECIASPYPKGKEDG